MTWNQAYDRYQDAPSQPFTASADLPLAAEAPPPPRGSIGHGVSPARLVTAAGVLLSAAVIAAFFFPRTPAPLDGGKLAALEQQVEKLAQQMTLLGKIDQALAQVNELSSRINERNSRMDELFSRLEDQGRRADKFVSRVDAMESALIERMVDIATLLDDLQKPAGAAGRPAVSAVPAPPATAAATGERKMPPRYHTVQAGETLNTIGRLYGMKINDLKRLNRLSSSDVLRPGQKLILSSS